MQPSEDLDTVIVGAGLSGIGAACHLHEQFPERTFALLEAREATGGTWDLFRYPGVRSDSDLQTFGFAFDPWRKDTVLGSGDQILEYLRDVAARHGITPHIRLGHQVTSAEWGSEQSRWTLHVRRADGNRVTISCRFLFSATGYYRYDQGHSPELPDLNRYQGQVVHPQHYPEGLDYAGKQVVVLGSGATAVTLVPALAPRAGHVTMLQRSPSYVLPIPSNDKLAQCMRRIAGPRLARRFTRRKNIFIQQALYRFCRAYPSLARNAIKVVQRRHLPRGFDLSTHFRPRYQPFDQRLCMVPDGDLFRAITAGAASVETGTIASFEGREIVLSSGRRLTADLLITATGLNMLALGGIELSIDGRTVELARTLVYKGAMLAGVPNFAFAVGYTNASWTLRVDLVCEWLGRVRAEMDARRAVLVVPETPAGDVPTRPMLTLGAGYVQRSMRDFPRQGTTAPWTFNDLYKDDVRRYRDQPVADGILTFSAAAVQPFVPVPDITVPRLDDHHPSPQPGWAADLLGDGYRKNTLELGADPDGEGQISATLIRREAAADERATAVALYVHGFNDYFFQRHLADALAGADFAFYALDLRKSGRSLRSGQTPHYVSDLRFYDQELDAALQLVKDAHPGLPVVAIGHSTGGLVLPLWLARRPHADRSVEALVLNSPWLDLPGSTLLRTAGTQSLRALAWVRPHAALPGPSDAYGQTLLRAGAWDSDPRLKPVDPFPVHAGWLNAVRRAQGRLHRGLELDVPTLVLCSQRSELRSTDPGLTDVADSVLDVTQICRWATAIGSNVTIEQIPQALHDVFLSRASVRERALALTLGWLAEQLQHQTPEEPRLAEQPQRSN